MKSRIGRLQARLLLWFLAAIVLALLASVVTTLLTRAESEPPTRVVSKHVQRRLAKIWDDPLATDAYVRDLREATGLDMRLRREPELLGGESGRGHGGSIVFDDNVAYVPIVRGGAALGVLELRTGSPAPKLWRVIAALVAALAVLGAVARSVSKSLAQPLEHLARTAERFGGGDLNARTEIEAMPRRWVAEEVRDVGRAFDGMADRIARVVIDQRELLAAISHELRSPLSRARIALEIARERTCPQASHDEVERQLISMDAILGDLLASARAGLSDVHLEDVDLMVWLQSRIRMETQGPIALTRAAGTEAVRVTVDTALLGRALHNLFANGWNHGHPATASIDVTVSVASGCARVAIRDHGPGFDEAILPRAFEPFVKSGDSARSPGSQGIGLGLSLVRRIVEAHGGTIAAANVTQGSASVGAEVAFQLPLASARFEDELKLHALPPID